MLDAGFLSLVGFRIPSAGFRIPNTRIPDSTSKKFLDSGIRIPLHGAKFRGYIPHILSKLRCTCLLRMSPDWIKFDTQLIISVQLLIRKRKAEKFSYVFKKKKNETINETSMTGYETIIFQVYSYSISRKVVGKSERGNPERYCGWF